MSLVQVAARAIVTAIFTPLPAAEVTAVSAIALEALIVEEPVHPTVIAMLMRLVEHRETSQDLVAILYACLSVDAHQQCPKEMHLRASLVHRVWGG